MPAVSAVVLAAGKSTRMGGPNKLLLPWGCSTVVGAVVGALRQCDVEIIVVTGRDADDVAQAVDPARTVFNEMYEEGMSTSIAKGVKFCPRGSAFLIALGDMPGLDPNVVKKLMANYREPTDIVVPVYSEEPDSPGHPVIFGSSYCGELAELIGDTGARNVVKENANHLKLVDCEGSLRDIDSTDDLAD